MIYATDCDLRRLHIVANDKRILVKGKSMDIALAVMSEVVGPKDKILYEIAGPVDYTDNKAIAHHKRRWTIYNSAAAARFDATFPGQVLVAPSSSWTNGFKEKERHALAGCRLSTHDLRECEAMLWFFGKNPDKWVTLDAFLDTV